MPLDLILLLLPVLIQLIEWYINRKKPVPKMVRNSAAHALKELNDRQHEVAALDKVYKDHVARFRELAAEAGIEPE